MIEQEFQIYKFAKKHVLRVHADSTLWEVIEMMNDFNIRHVPVVKGSKVLGVINPSSLIRGLGNYCDPKTLFQPAKNFISEDYFIVDDYRPLMDVIRHIALNPSSVALLMNDSSFHGIFTEMDILNNDYLWRLVEDFEIDSRKHLGVYIDEFNCIPSTTSIQQALMSMTHLGSEMIGYVDGSTRILSGVLSIMDIIHLLMHHHKELGDELDFVWHSPINTIFPRSGLYIKEPITLSSLRAQMYDSSSYLSILLGQNNYPEKIISIHDIIQLFSTAVNFRDDSWFYV